MDTVHVRHSVKYMYYLYDTRTDNRLTSLWPAIYWEYVELQEAVHVCKTLRLVVVSQAVLCRVDM